MVQPSRLCSGPVRPAGEPVLLGQQPLVSGRGFHAARIHHRPEGLVHALCQRRLVRWQRRSLWAGTVGCLPWMSPALGVHRSSGAEPRYPWKSWQPLPSQAHQREVEGRFGASYLCPSKPAVCTQGAKAGGKRIEKTARKASAKRGCLRLGNGLRLSSLACKACADVCKQEPVTGRHCRRSLTQPPCCLYGLHQPPASALGMGASQACPSQQGRRGQGGCKSSHSELDRPWGGGG